MSNARCAVCVTFQIRPEHVAKFREAVLAQAKNSLSKEPWCHQFEVCTDPEQPNAFLLFETYDDREAFHTKHRQTEHFAIFIQNVEPWIESKQLKVWDIQ